MRIVEHQISLSLACHQSLQIRFDNAGMTHLGAVFTQL